MLIQSQDKKCVKVLTNVNSIWATPYEMEGKYAIWIDGTNFGIYKSERDAMKVLDSIIKGYSLNQRIGEHNYYAVGNYYVMPEETCFEV